MKVHYERTPQGAYRGSFFVQPQDGMDGIVRRALGLEYTENLDLQTAARRGADIPQKYIIDGPNATIYQTGLTMLVQTTYQVSIPKGEGKVRVDIDTRLPLRQDLLEDMIKIAAIQEDLQPKGLVPMDVDEAEFSRR
ncbi:MAG: hypothetical protein WCV90_05935 [Candidatus Woesearchaeota archaeon]